MHCNNSLYVLSRIILNAKKDVVTLKASEFDYYITVFHFVHIKMKTVISTVTIIQVTALVDLNKRSMFFWPTSSKFATPSKF